MDAASPRETARCFVEVSCVGGESACCGASVVRSLVTGLLLAAPTGASAGMMLLHVAGTSAGGGPPHCCVATGSLVSFGMSMAP